VRDVRKGEEPRSLLEHRVKAHSTYENYPHKDELRVALVREQNGLCCYCMGRIRANAESMKIEHWQCQATYPDLQLTYTNLLGACTGGDGQAANEHHCDTRKANRDLKWNPANDAHPIEPRVSYGFDGKISSVDPEFGEQVDSVLALNLPVLRSNRKAVLDVVLQWWRLTPPAKRNLQAQIDRRTREQDEHEPFSPVAVWFLRQKLAGTA